jgi:hypothetical protein
MTPLTKRFRLFRDVLCQIRRARRSSNDKTSIQGAKAADWTSIHLKISKRHFESFQCAYEKYQIRQSVG